MPDTVVDLVGQGDGVCPWGGRWPPCWDSASSYLGSEGTRDSAPAELRRGSGLPPTAPQAKTASCAAPHPRPQGEGLASR